MRNPMLHDVENGLEVYRQHIAATTGGMANHVWRQQTPAAQCEKRPDVLLDLGLRGLGHCVPDRDVSQNGRRQ